MMQRKGWTLSLKWGSLSVYQEPTFRYKVDRNRANCSSVSSIIIGRRVAQQVQLARVPVPIKYLEIIH